MRDFKLLALRLLLIFSGSGFMATATDYEIANKIFLPPEFYVGDEVELRLTVRLKNNLRVVLPEIMPKGKFIKIERISQKKTDNTILISIFFRSYTSGKSYAPVIDFGGFEMNALEINTASIIREDQILEPEPLIAPLYTPRTTFYMAILLGLLGAVPTACVFGFKKIRKYLRQRTINQKFAVPFQNFIKVLSFLNNSLLSYDSESFYARLIAELKKYLGERTGQQFAHLTTDEARINLLKIFPETLWRFVITGLMQSADEVKFGGKRSFTSDRQQDLTRAKICVSLAEDFFIRKLASQQQGEA